MCIRDSFKITNDVKRVAVDKGKQRFPGVSVVADAGSEISHPSTHRGANLRLRQLPLCLFQRRLCGINAGLHRFNIEVSGIAVSYTHLDVYKRQFQHGSPDHFHRAEKYVFPR